MTDNIRTIKFKAKRLYNGEWVKGDLMQHLDGNILIGDNEEPFVDDGLSSCDYHHVYPIDPETIGQFSGLYDKNKNEIYEGDILRVPGTRERIEVRYVRGVFAFLWNGDLDDEAPINAPTQEWAEVIGNIHDNPKLLKRKK